MRKRVQRLLGFMRASLFTLIIHGAIILFLVYGLFSEPEKMKAAGKPIQAVTISQAELDEKKQEEVRKLEELEAQRKAEEEEKKRLEEEAEKKQLEEQAEKKQLEEAEKKRLEEEERKKQEELKKKEEQQRRSRIKEDCVELVRQEDESGETNSELDDICEQEREQLVADKKAAEQKRIEEEERLQAEAEKKRLEEEERKQAEAEKKRKEQEAQKKAEEEKRRKAEEARIAEEQRQAELEMQAKLAEEQRQALAAQTEQEAENAFQAVAGRIKSLVENNWRRPAGSQVGLKAVFEISISSRGEVLDVQTVRSSGDKQFDRSADLAIKKASPLPIPTNPKYYEYFKVFQIEFSPDD